MQTSTDDIILTQGLVGQDAKVDVLMRLWDELLTSSADVVQASCPDMFSFALNAFYFAVISAKKWDKGKTKSSAPQNAGVGDVSPPGKGSRSRGGGRKAVLGYDVGEPAKKADYLQISKPVELFGQLLQAKKNIPDTTVTDVAARPPMDIDFLEIPSTDDIEDNTDNYNTDYHIPESVGIVFVTSSPNANGPSSELSIGIVLDKPYRNRGFARQAVQLVMQWVFDDLKFHRLQAVILDCPRNDRALTLFTQLGFGHEGTRRHSVFSQVDMCWKDATYLAMLDTDWLNRLYFKPAPKSLWDEMFLRHERERQELLRWEESSNVGLTRTISMETICVGSGVSNRSTSISQPDGQEDVAPGPSPSNRAKDKRKREETTPLIPRTAFSPCPSSLSGSENSFVSIPDAFGDDFEEKQAELDKWRCRVTSLPPSSASGRSSEPIGSPGGSVHSQWDLLETSSADGSLRFESPEVSDDDE